MYVSSTELAGCSRIGENTGTRRLSGDNRDAKLKLLHTNWLKCERVYNINY